MNLAPFRGATGILIGVATRILVAVAMIVSTRNYNRFNMDVPGMRNSFDPVLTRYLKIAEVVVGLAAGSIVLLVGSSALHGSAQKLPGFYATPLFLLAFAILYAILFSVWLIIKYEAYQHDGSYSRVEYAISNMFGFSGLFCFVLGYVLLIARVTS